MLVYYISLRYRGGARSKLTGTNGHIQDNSCVVCDGESCTAMCWFPNTWWFSPSIVILTKYPYLY